MKSKIEKKRKKKKEKRKKDRKKIIDVINKLNLKLLKFNYLTASPTMQIRAMKNLQPIDHQKMPILDLLLTLISQTDV